VSATVAVPIFPGTNSEDETVRVLRALGLDARTVHWSAGAAGLRGFDAYVLAGGFAYEDRIRAGAVAAHDAMTAAIVDAALAGSFVIGICNGAQIVLETGLVPGTGALRRPTAAFAPNIPGARYRNRQVYVKLAGAPERSPLLASLAPATVIPAWASHGEGRLAATPDELARIERDGHLAYVYCDRRGSVTPESTPNGSALACAGLINSAGNVLALMPHPERIAWTYQQLDPAVRGAARGSAADAQRPAGGIVFFRALASALGEAAVPA
jgi:phosphoribosylformylglycinamidine synthase I